MSACYVLIACAFALATADTDSSCDLYMANSLNQNFGRGVFAGKTFRKNANVEQSVSILVHNDLAMNSQLEYFVYASDEENYAVAVLGAAMMFNSLADESVAHQWESEDVPPIESVEERAHTNYTDFVFVAERPVRIGDEIYANYGDRWFQDRNIQQTKPEDITPARYDLSTLRSEGHCLTDLIVQESSIPMAGRGLFTTRAYRAGDIVSISPVVVLSRSDILDTEGTVLLNYCISQNESDVALFPIGRAAMINHGGRYANVKVEWHFWDESKRSHLTMPLEEVMALPYSPFDLQYVATKDLQPGEELLLSYGEQWERDWLQYVDALTRHTQMHTALIKERSGGSQPDTAVPQFRGYIAAPSQLFPSHFMVDCAGRWCGSDREANGVVLEELEHRAATLAEAAEYARKNFLIGKECESGV